jgi:hypothetical protein
LVYGRVDDEQQLVQGKPLHRKSPLRVRLHPKDYAETLSKASAKVRLHPTRA